MSQTETPPPGTTAASARTSGVGRVTVVCTAAMTVSMLQLYLLGALGPTLVRELRLTAWQLGALVGAGFAVAAALSLPAGGVVDRVGARRGLVVLFVLASAAIAVLSLAGGGWWVLAAVLIGGLAQALANPATNRLILVAVPAHRRGAATGWKQSGVQWGAFLAGLPLAWLASMVSWRIGVASMAGLSLLGALAAARTRTPAAPAGASPSALRAVFRPRVLLLAQFSVALGAGLATVNTYLALFAHARLGMSDPSAAALVAVLGVAGIVGRVGWSRLAARRADPATLLPWLAFGAGLAAVLLALAEPVGTALAWLGATGVGVLGVAGNAVSMIAVMRAVPVELSGRAAALVSTGFFAGFAVGPPIGGMLVGRAGYGWLWSSVAVVLGVAAVLAAAMTRAGDSA